MLSNRELTPNPNVVFTVVDDAAILLEQETGKYFSLNPVGTRMWLLLSEHGRLDKVQEQMLTEFDVEADKLQEDLENMVEKLIENGLLT